MKKLTLSIVAALSAVTVFADAAPTMNDGWKLLDTGKHAEAEKVFRAIAAKEALVDRYSGTNGLMFALRRQKRNAEVAKEVDSWIAKNTDATINQKASLYVFKGNALRDLNKIDEALAAYKTGLDLKSSMNGSSDCAKEYILVAINAGKMDLAKQIYEEASKQPASMKNIGFLIRGAYLMWKSNQPELGLKLLADATKIKHPAYLDEEIYRIQGYIYRECVKNQEEAVKAFEKALAVPGINDYQKAVLWNNIGMAYERDDEFEKAVEAYKKVGTFKASGWFMKSAENSAKRLQKKIDAGE